MKRVWIAVLVLFAAVAALFVRAPTFVLNAASLGGDVTIERDIPFGSDLRLKLDIYRPAKAAGPLPVVVFFYGGSWQRGDKSIYRFLGVSLARAGIVAVIPDYRLYPPVLYPDFLHDSALAARWAKDNSAHYGGDPAKLFLAGHSAGAYNAISLASDRRWLAGVKLDPKADVSGVIGIAGPYDFLPLKNEQLKVIFGPEAERPLTQPINYVDGDEPPMPGPRGRQHGGPGKLGAVGESDRTKGRYRHAENLCPRRASFHHWDIFAALVLSRAGPGRFRELRPVARRRRSHNEIAKPGASVYPDPCGNVPI